MGKGECAGEVVSLVQFELSGCETEVFEAQIHLEKNDYEAAYKTAFSSMLHAAKALVKTQFLDVPEDADSIIEEFRTRFCDTELFYHPQAGAKFANYLFRIHEDEITEYTRDIAHQVTEEAQLFIEATYACYGQMNVV